MKQIIRYTPILVMLFVCSIASAQSTIKLMTIKNGTVIVDKTSASKGTVVTMTVTPNEGYYIRKEDINVLKIVNPNHAQGRGDVPIGYYVTINGDDPSDVSQPRNYTFTVPDNGYELQVSAGFKARTSISQRMVALSSSEFTYNGSTQKPTVSIDGFTEVADYEVVFAEKEWKNAGWYSITITGKGRCRGIVNTGFIIASKEIENPIISLSQSVYTYNGTEKQPTVTVKEGNTTIPASEYTVSYSDNIDVGEATANIYSVSGGNYFFEGSATFSIIPADGNVTPPVGKSGLIYTGNLQELITPGSSTTGTVRYSLDGINYSIVIPKGVEVADYTVYYDVMGDLNYNDVDPQSIVVTISPKKVSSPKITLSQISYTYDGTAKKPTVTVKDGDIEIPDTEYSVSYSNNTNVGTATVKITDKDGGNYTVSGSATFSIAAADGSLKPPTGKSGLVYTGETQNLINAGSSTTGTVLYSLDGTNYSTSIPQGIDAKEYTIYYKVVAKAGYSGIAPASFIVTIAPKAVDSPAIALSQTSYFYDGTAKTPAVTSVKDGETVIPALEYTVSYENNTNVGTATVKITDKDGGNYTISGSTTFGIISADGNVTPPTGKSGLVYTGERQNLINAGSSTTGTVQYSLDGTNYSTSIPQGIDAKEYTIYYKVVAKAGYNGIAPASFIVTIAPKAVDSPAIALSQTSYFYDGTAKTPAVTFVKDGETVIPAPEYTVSYENNRNVGTATVKITDKDGGNYTVSGFTTFWIGIRGDANGDNKVDAADIVEMVNETKGQPSAKFKKNNADIDGNGQITDADITEVAKIILVK